MDLSNSYKIIYDGDQVKRFIKMFMPKSSQQCLVIYLCARRKYYPSLTGSEFILDRLIFHGGNADQIDNLCSTFLRKLYRWHTPVGTFVHGDDASIPQEALCVYALLLPKDPIKAMGKLWPKLIDALTDGNEVAKPFSFYKKEIGKTNAVVPKEEQLMMVDLDTKDPEKLEQTRDLLITTNISKHIKIIIETKNGYHIIYTKSGDIDGKRLFEFKTTTKFMKPNVNGKPTADFWFSIAKAAMSIIPGTLQGGFEAKICDDFFGSTGSSS